MRYAGSPVPPPPDEQRPSHGADVREPHDTPEDTCARHTADAAGRAVRDRDDRAEPHAHQRETGDDRGRLFDDDRRAEPSGRDQARAAHQPDRSEQPDERVSREPARGHRAREDGEAGRRHGRAGAE